MNRLLLCMLVLLLGCSTPQKRVSRIIKRHPECFNADTNKVSTIVRSVFVVDSAGLDSLNTEYESILADLSNKIDSLEAIPECNELARTVKITDLKTVKLKIDTVYKQGKCIIKPFYYSDENLIISAKQEGDSIRVDFFAEKYKICEQKEYWQYIEFWVAPMLLCLVIIVNAIKYIKNENI